MNTTDVLPIISGADWDYYVQKAHDLFDSYKSLDTNTIQHIRKYHPDSDMLDSMSGSRSRFTQEDAYLIVAREHGFEDPGKFKTHLLQMATPGSAIWTYECAADAIVDGDRALLKELLSQNPGLVQARSSRFHHASLLHYVSANGIENFRQKSHSEVVDIAGMLLEAGIEPDCLAKVYSETWGTTLELVVSSVHPAKAGVQVALVEKLLDHGAAINGINDDCSPVATAICFHYPESADILAKRGARIDNLVIAAAMGDLGKVQGFLDERGKMLPDVPLFNVGWLKMECNADTNLQLAFVWAAMNNRLEMVTYLVGIGVSLTARDHRQWTALHWAAYLGHVEIFEFLLAKKAPLEARNEFGGTVLDQTLWATIHLGLGPSHLDIIRKLVAAGARVHPWWLFESLTPPLEIQVINILEGWE